MVFQCLAPPPLPRALLPASSLEPLTEDERVICSFERVRVAAGGTEEDAAASAADDAHAGTLHVTNRRLVWLPSENTSSSVGGFQAGFASIVMHALQGGGGGSGSGEGGGGGDNKSSQPPPAPAAVYLQLDDDGDDDADEAAFRGTGEFDDASEGEGEGEGEGEDEEDKLPSTRPPNDLRLVPLAASSSSSSSSDRASSASTIAKEIFAAMCEAAAMNPTGEEIEGDDDGEWFYDEREVAEGCLSAAAAGDSASLSSAGAERLARYDALLHMPRAEDLDELLDDEEGFDDEEGEEGSDNDDDDDDGRFDDPEPEATTTTAKT